MSHILVRITIISSKRKQISPFSIVLNASSSATLIISFTDTSPILFLPAKLMAPSMAFSALGFVSSIIITEDIKIVFNLFQKYFLLTKFGVTFYK